MLLRPQVLVAACQEVLRSGSAALHVALRRCAHASAPLVTGWLRRVRVRNGARRKRVGPRRRRCDRTRARMGCWDNKRTIAASVVHDILRGRHVTAPDPTGYGCEAPASTADSTLVSITSTIPLEFRDCFR